MVKDGNYGSENSEQKGGWDGMVGELVRRVSWFYNIQHKIILIKLNSIGDACIVVDGCIN